VLSAFPDTDTPVAAPKKQDLANEILKDFRNVFFCELVIPPSQLRYQKHQYLHLNYIREEHEKLHSNVLHAGALGMNNLRAVHRGSRACESCCDVIKGWLREL
jgi:hypothetical protein